MEQQFISELLISGQKQVASSLGGLFLVKLFTIADFFLSFFFFSTLFPEL